jgi:hypothetical protein
MMSKGLSPIHQGLILDLLSLQFSSRLAPLFSEGPLKTHVITKKATNLQELPNPHTITREAIYLPLFGEIFSQLRAFMPHAIIGRSYTSHFPVQLLFRGWTWFF